MIQMVWAVFFSPAGGTRTVTEYIGEETAYLLGVPLKRADFTLPVFRECGSFRFGKEDLVVFGMPTYAGRIPNKALPFVRGLFTGEGTPALALVTFGNRSYDSSLTELTGVLGERGFAVFGAGAFVCRHVFSDRIAAGRPDGDDFPLMKDFAARAVRRLSEGDLKAPLIRDGAPVGPYYVPLREDGKPAGFLKAKPRLDPERCLRCGDCARYCPMGAISPEDPEEVPGTCVKCQACLIRCPAGARYFDDPDFLSHVRMLEEHCGERRQPEWFFG